MNRRASWIPVWAVIRLLAAALGIAAVIAQLIRTVSIAVASETPYGSHLPTIVANFFSFFTVQSNILAAAVLAALGLLTLTRGRHGTTDPPFLATALACVTTYMVVTGIVYNVLLRGVPISQGQTVGWSDEILHVVIPVFLLLDLFVAPERRRLAWPTIWIVIVYPLAWAAYTLIRANLVVNPGNGNPWWYPYPFLDPHQPGGYGTVVAYVVGIALAIAAAAVLVIGVGRWRARPLP